MIQPLFDAKTEIKKFSLFFGRIKDTTTSFWNFLTFKGEDPKYIAQAGVLRGEPDGIIGRCAVFRYGPGLNPFWSNFLDISSLDFKTIAQINQRIELDVQNTVKNYW